MAICDLTYLKNITPGNNTFAITVITMFINDTPSSIKGMNDALTNNDWPELYKHAHKIKPSIEMLGLPKDLVNTLLKINEYTKNQINIEEIPNLIQDFCIGIEDVFADLKNVLVELSN